MWVEHALTHGHIDVLDHAGIGQRAPVAVAVWFHGHDQPAPLQERYELRLAQTCVEHAPHFHELDAAMEGRHPDQPPHHHLAFVATHPSAQGHGLGSRLVRAHHARLDRPGLPAFTEARDTRSRDWLAHYGYRVTAPYRLPGHGPRMWAMWRDRVT